MKKNLTFLFGLSQCAYWCGFAVVSAFASLYLLGIGVSNSSIGIVMAVGALISAVLQPVLGTLADRFPAFSARRILTFLILLSSISAVIMLLLGNRNILVICVLYAGCVMALQIMQPFINSLAMMSINDGYELNFSITRAVGSIGYAFAAYVIGVLGDRFGGVIVPIFIIITFVMLLATLLFFPAHKSSGNFESINGEGEGMKDEEALDSQGILSTKQEKEPFFFAKYPKYGILFFGLIMIYFGHVLINNFTLQIIQTKGGQSAEMGSVASLAALIELFMMLSFTRIRKYVSLATLLRVSGLFFAIKVLASLLVPNVAGYYAIQIFQLFGWGIMCVGLVLYVNEIMAPEDVVKGQAYATMTYTIGSIVASWIGGVLLDVAGVNVMLIVGSIISFVGAGIIFAGTERK